MAHQCGQKDNTPQSRPKSILYAFGRAVGFALFAGLGLTLLAALAFIPNYYRLMQARYVRDCEKAALADDRAEKDAGILRVNDGNAKDRFLTEKMAYITLGKTLDNSSRAVDVDDPDSRQGQFQSHMVSITLHDKPDVPAEWLMNLAKKLQTPARRRGLWLLMTASVLTAMLLFSKPDDERETQPDKPKEA